MSTPMLLRDEEPPAAIHRILKKEGEIAIIYHSLERFGYYGLYLEERSCAIPIPDTEDYMEIPWTPNHDLQSL